jgi:hypothetical protein
MSALTMSVLIPNKIAAIVLLIQNVNGEVNALENSAHSI